MTEYTILEDSLIIKPKNSEPIRIYILDYTNDGIKDLDELIDSYRVKYCQRDKSITAKLFFKLSNEKIIDKVIEAHYKYRFAWFGTLLTAIIADRHEELLDSIS